MLTTTVAIRNVLCHRLSTTDFFLLSITLTEDVVHMNDFLRRVNELPRGRFSGAMLSASISLAPNWIIGEVAFIVFVGLLISCNRGDVRYDDFHDIFKIKCISISALRISKKLAGRSQYLLSFKYFTFIYLEIRIFQMRSFISELSIWSRLLFSYLTIHFYPQVFLFLWRIL